MMDLDFQKNITISEKDFTYAPFIIDCNMNEIKKFEKEGIGVETGKGAGGGRVT